MKLCYCTACGRVTDRQTDRWAIASTKISRGNNDSGRKKYRMCRLFASLVSSAVGKWRRLLSVGGYTVPFNIDAISGTLQVVAAFWVISFALPWKVAAWSDELRWTLVAGRRGLVVSGFARLTATAFQFDLIRYANRFESIRFVKKIGLSIH